MNITSLVKRVLSKTICHALSTGEKSIITKITANDCFQKTKKKLENIASLFHFTMTMICAFVAA